MKPARLVLFQYGYPPVGSGHAQRLLSKPFQFVKCKKSAREEARKILDTNELYIFPQEGFRTIFAVGPLDVSQGGELPRIIWVQLDSGLWAGWSRTRQRQKAYKDYRDWQKVTPGAPLLKGKSA